MQVVRISADLIGQNEHNNQQINTIGTSGPRSGGWLAATLMDSYFHHSFPFFSHFPFPLAQKRTSILCIIIRLLGLGVALDNSEDLKITAVGKADDTALISNNLLTLFSTAYLFPLGNWEVEINPQLKPHVGVLDYNWQKRLAFQSFSIWCSGGRHVSRPCRPFWGPLAAILDFAGDAALQAVSECPLRR